MARTLISRDSSLRTWINTLGLGIGIGVLYWILTAMLNKYVVEPIACGAMSSASQCVSSITIAGSIATILTAVVAIFAALRLTIARPLLVAIAAGALLWGLSGWTNGLFWLESLGWTVLAYALAYALFSWMNRYSNMLVVIITSIIIIIAEHIVLTF